MILGAEETGLVDYSHPNQNFKGDRTAHLNLMNSR